VRVQCGDHNPVKGVKRPKVESHEGKTPALGDGQATAMAKAGHSVPVYAYALNNPGNVIDQDGENPILILLGLDLWFGPRAWIGFDDADFARERTRGRLPGTRNGQSDAMRHCIWNCEMTRDLGPLWATIMADYVYESGGWVRGQLSGDPPNPAERSMDLHNNQCGRDAAAKERQTCVTACDWAYGDGTLRTLPRNSTQW
jgi:hypothetical protein